MNNLNPFKISPIPEISDNRNKNTQSNRNKKKIEELDFKKILNKEENEYRVIRGI